MTQRDIKQKRTESVLKELIPQALSQLEDEQLKGLCVTEVVCHRGRYDAEVFLDKTILTASEISQIYSKLNKVKRHIQNYCALEEGWFRAPSLTFHFDDLLDEQNRIDKLFDKIEEELKKNG
ncbi:MAG: 30S ribosome-binding factor RbfA [Campylobacteraceae bacterium]|jgi:ribosome-binding factor A|nr:30S ribosome-binding factor RbfA [Campylobacteraceae bacterium]